MASRAGSHAGRGFRYQDAVAAWFAIEAWLGRSPYGLVTPEGHDDIELRDTDGRTLGQVKSRRAHLGAFSATTVAKYIEALWARGSNSDRYLLVIEAPIEGATLDDGNAVPLADVAALRDALAGVSPGRVAATKVLMLPRPTELATEAVSVRLGCTMLEGRTLVGSVIGKMGELADANGVRPGASYVGLSTSDTQRDFDRLSSVLQSSFAQEALELGLCEAVEFTIEVNDASFYLGVDVQPGHVTAGLIVERPQLRDDILDTLSSRRNVLIRGPSGAGKSALLWESAHASRHTVRWFRIRRLAGNQVHLLVRLAESCLARPHAPVGFVLDDVGAGLTEGWSSLARELRARPDVVMLSSVREEDLSLLVGRSSAADAPLVNDDAVAERIWSELRARGQTAWQGWKEPWARSNGLLLEYVYILTQGTRLSAVLAEQVAARESDVQRRNELRLLRYSACAGAAGTQIETRRLPSALQVTDEDVSVSLRRLVDEHLVRELHGGRLAGLHELRSRELLRLTHEVPPPELSDTMAATARLVPEDGLGQFIARSLEREPGSMEALIESVCARLRAEPSLKAASAALMGFGQCQIQRTLGTWMDLVSGVIPPSQLAITGMFGITGIDMPALGGNDANIQASLLMRSIKQELSASDPRAAVLTALGQLTIQALLQSTSDPQALDEFLGALLGAPLDEGTARLIASTQPDLMDADLQAAASLLATTRAIDISIARTWVDRVGQQALLNRVANEVPWATMPELREEGGGLAVCADVRYLSPSEQKDAHGEVVDLCDILGALVPDAALVISNAVSADGLPAGYRDYQVATKRIPRENLPARALVSWNKRWSAALDAQIAPSSYTNYLARTIELLNELVVALTGALDCLLRSQGAAAHLAKLELVQREAREMGAVRPAEVLEADATSSKSLLQSILFSGADLISRFLKLPAQANLFVHWLASFMKDIDRAINEEPWRLLGASAPNTLRQLRNIVADLRNMAGNSSLSGIPPALAYRQRTAKAGRAWPSGGAQAKRQLQACLARLVQDLKQRLTAEDPHLQVFIRETLETATWPPVEILVLSFEDSLAQWAERLGERWAAARGAVPANAPLLMVPAIRGRPCAGFAMSGFDQPTPALGAFDAWGELVTAPAWLEPRADEFRELIAAITEIDGIQAFGYGADGRPMAERRALAQAEVSLTAAHQRLLGMSLSPEVSDLLSSLIADVRSRRVQLARDVTAITRGEANPTLAVMAILSIHLTEQDIAEQSDNAVVRAQ